LNRLTEIPWRHYSGRMISEFDELPEKINQLAELARSLRRENADLRRAMVALGEENADLSRRIQQAHQRVSALLDKIPASASDESEETA
jgi:cell division protein ZapB